jgi:hypothetical protein
MAEAVRVPNIQLLFYDLKGRRRILCEHFSSLS